MESLKELGVGRAACPGGWYMGCTGVRLSSVRGWCICRRRSLTSWFHKMGSIKSGMVSLEGPLASVRQVSEQTDAVVPGQKVTQMTWLGLDLVAEVGMQS